MKRIKENLLFIAGLIFVLSPVLIVVASCVIVFYKQSQIPAAPIVKRTISDIKIGDVVSIKNEDYDYTVVDMIKETADTNKKYVLKCRNTLPATSIIVDPRAIVLN